MGTCGSKAIPTHGDAGAARNLSRWQADGGDAEATKPASGTVDVGNATYPRDDTASDLTLNSVVAYRMAAASNGVTTEMCVTGWEDGSIKFQNWNTHAVVSTFAPHSRAVNRIVIGAKTSAIYSCSRDMTIAIVPAPSRDFSVEMSPPAMVLSGHTLNVSTITLDSTESTLCSGGRDTQTILWDLATAKAKAKNTTAQNVITCSKWLPGERVIGQGSEDLSVKLWDERTGLRAPTETLRGYIYFPLCLDVTCDGLYLLTSSKGFNGVGSETRVWDRRTGKQLHQLEGHQQDATACCFLSPPLSTQAAESQLPPCIPTLVTASKDGTVKVWDASTNQLICEAHEPSAHMFTSISHAGGSVILASTFHGRVHAFQLDLDTKSLALLN